MNNTEVWKDIPNYEGLYQVSNMGNVKSLERYVNDKGGKRFQKGKILKLCGDGKGYYQVGLNKEGKRKGIKVHVLVAMVFLNHVPGGHEIEVDHKNEIRTDNRLENLQLLPIREHKTKTSKNRNTSSKYTGVSWHKHANKWHSYITIDKRRKHLGLYEKEIDAHLAYQKALIQLNK